MDLSQLRRGVDLLAAAVKATPSTAAPWSEWATVASVGAIPTVKLDSDWQQVPRPVSANAAGALAVDWRVLVLHEGPRLTIVSAPLANAGAGSVHIGGTTYATSGTWAGETLSSPSYSSAPVYAWTLTKALPYTPPSGWGFSACVVSSNGFAVANAAGTSGGNLLIRLVNINSSGPYVQLGWSLVKL